MEAGQVRLMAQVSRLVKGFDLDLCAAFVRVQPAHSFPHHR